MTGLIASDRPEFSPMMISTGNMHSMALLRHPGIDGLDELLGMTLASRAQVTIAMLDGPVDRSHPSLCGARLRSLETLVSGNADWGRATQHGTHVASILFAVGDGPLTGIAAGCRGLIVPVFVTDSRGDLAECSQIDLARAIVQAVEHGARVVNISAGQFAPPGAAHPFLVQAVRHCSDRDVLIVAAAGNDGCECLHLPAALPPVLAVGAMDRQGLPLDFSNWGSNYRTQGILAPGADLLGAAPGGGLTRRTGTSFATAVVSGVAGLLFSLQMQRGQKPNAAAVRAAILNSAVGCRQQMAPDCRRLLAGRLNVKGAVSLILQGVDAVSVSVSALAESQTTLLGPDSDGTSPPMIGTGVQAASYESAVSQACAVAPHQSTTGAEENPAGGIDARLRPRDSNGVAPSGCGCAASEPTQLVYPLGALGFDLQTEARRDSLAQQMVEPRNPYDPASLLTYLKQNPWDSQAVTWTLNLDATTLYAIRPGGAFARDVYERLREFLHDQITENVTRVSIPGFIRGSTRLMSGQVVPVIEPVLRGMCSWTTKALVDSVSGELPPRNSPHDAREKFLAKSQGVQDFLERIYSDVRNLGVTPEERAINFAATNAFNIDKVFESAIKDEMALDSFEVERSPICRPDSDCWDVKIYFFFPQRQVQTVRRVYRFTVDVSDVVPVTVGSVRSWFAR
jgi:cyanobactin maturation PatA/PatG family protease